jgi:hypothetical protein
LDRVERYIFWSNKVKKALLKSLNTKRLKRYIEETDNILRVFLKPHAKFIIQVLKGDREVARCIGEFVGIGTSFR